MGSGQGHVSAHRSAQFLQGHWLMGVDTTWWEYTGEYGPFINGISSPYLRNMQTGEVVASPDLPAGALWVDDQNTYAIGHDGKCVICKLPDGHYWYIDSRAGNCKWPREQKHCCWARQGTVGDRLTVVKG